MEEDIKILENILKTKEYGLCEITDTFYKAIENLLKRYKELEEELERQKEINTIINKENLDYEYEKALEKVMSKFLNDNVNNDFISKSKIKEKIEEIKEKDKACKTYTKDGRENFITEYLAIKVLQELMEDK